MDGASTARSHRRRSAARGPARRCSPWPPRAGGAIHPVVAVQRYGQGRSMVFGGEASWRWRMMMASTDRSYELFWRQASRWLSEAAPDPVTIAAARCCGVGRSVSIDVDARDPAFALVADAAVDGHARRAGRQRADTDVSPRGGIAGPIHVRLRARTTGCVSRAVEATRGRESLGTSDRWMLVGGGDREFVDPTPERRIASTRRADDWRSLRARERRASVVSWLQDTARQTR